MFFMNYDLEKMAPEDHALRTIKNRFPAQAIAEKKEEWKKCLGREGYGIETGIKALFLQFWGDYSDREMEERLRYDLSYKWFCGFKMEDSTPDHTYFCRVRKNLGEKWVEELFNKITEDETMRKVIKKLESFVDASAIRRKEAEWKKRDEDREKEQKEIDEAIRKSKEARWETKRSLGHSAGTRRPGGDAKERRNTGLGIRGT